MNAKQVNSKIKIDAFIALLGHYPAKRYYNYLMYKSMLRADDRMPSLRISTDKNLFIDYGTGESGTLIDFVLLLYPSFTVSDAIKYVERVINSTVAETKSDSFFFQKQEFRKNEPQEALVGLKYEIIKVQPLQNQALISYVNSRGIKTELAQVFLQEVYYKTSSKKNAFACCISNSLGGYVIRNKFVKGNLLKTSFTHIIGTDPDAWLLMIYEGIFSALSDLQMNGAIGKVAYHILILNSCSNVNTISHIIDCYHVVNLRLDNDDTGRATADKIIQMAKPGQEIFSTAFTYSEYNDLNDKLLITLINN